MIEVETRLRVGRGIGKTETQASLELLQQLKRRGHPEAPPPWVSDGGAVIGKPCLKSTVKCRSTAGGDAHHRSNSPLPGGQYVQRVKQGEKGRGSGVKSRVIFGNPEQVYAALQRHTAYIERTNLTSRGT